MGCWNTTCGISGLPIFPGEEVVVFLLTQNSMDFMENFVGINTYFDPCLLPFYGQYNDYGDVENCYGMGLPILIGKLKEKLVENFRENFVPPNKEKPPYYIRERLDRDIIASRILHEENTTPLYSIFRDCFLDFILEPDMVFMENGEYTPVKKGALIIEMLKGALINNFMFHIRKPWIKQVGNGCQHNEPEPYKLLMKGMQHTLKKEKEERDRW